MNNKFSRFLKTVPMKLWVILVAVVFFSFFSNDFGLVDIQKSAIILAAGIDKGEEGYRLTTQIAVPKGTDRTTGGTSSVEITGKGETVSDCVVDIYALTGWVPKFVFCNLLLIGEDTAKEADCMHVLDFFFRNEYMPDSCFVAVSQGSAEEMLASQSAVDDTSSLAITRLFSNASVKSGRVMKNTLREFVISYYGPSESGFMPFVCSFEQESGTGTESSGGGQGGQNSNGGGSQKKEKVYCVRRTALFKNGRMASILNEEQTFACNLVKGKVFSGSFVVDDNGKPVSITVLDNDGGVKFETKTTPKATLTVKLTVRLLNRSTPSSVDDVSLNVVTPELLQKAEDTIRTRLEEVFALLRETGCDLFQLNRSLYRASKAKYEEWKDTLLATVPAEFDIKIKSTK